MIKLAACENYVLGKYLPVTSKKREGERAEKLKGVVAALMRLEHVINIFCA